MNDSLYMKRCFELARLGAGSVSPNPMVGSIIVLDGLIVGEGWHERYGQAHAEVRAVADALKHISESDLRRATMYVNLEPCSHWGRTPPCADMIVERGIGRVVVGCVDSCAKVSGAGIARLRGAGVDVTVGVLEREARMLNRRFFTAQATARPYVILKWATTTDGYMDAMRPASTPAVWMTGAACKTFVHKMRAENDAVMVGRATTLMDNPSLTVRNYVGRNPLRVVVDRSLTLPATLSIFDDQAPTLLITDSGREQAGRAAFAGHPSVEVKGLSSGHGGHFEIKQVLETLHQSGVQSLMVEGGACVLNSFIDSGLWDEAYIFRSDMSVRDLYPSLPFAGGMLAPTVARDSAASVVRRAELGLEIISRGGL